MKLAKWRHYTGTLVDYDFVNKLIRDKVGLVEGYVLEFFDVFEKYNFIRMHLVLKPKKTEIESGLFIFETDYSSSISRTITIELDKFQELLGVKHHIIKILDLSKQKDGTYSEIYSPSEVHEYLEKRTFLCVKLEDFDGSAVDIPSEPIVMIEEK